EFDLLTPNDGTISANPADITQLTWQPSASAPTYLVLLFETSNPGGPMVNAAFSAAADGDALTCDGGQCVYTLSSPLASGDYVWTVTANNGFEAENAPFNFTIDNVNRTELVVNGGFEANNNKGRPTTWKVKKAGKSTSVCESGTKHPEYQGACSFMFAGGSKTKLTQNLNTTGLAAGQLLTLNASAELQKAAAGGQVKLTVTYGNGTKDTLKLKFSTLSRPW